MKYSSSDSCTSYSPLGFSTSSPDATLTNSFCHVCQSLCHSLTLSCHVSCSANVTAVRSNSDQMFDLGHVAVLSCNDWLFQRPVGHNYLVKWRPELHGAAWNKWFVMHLSFSRPHNSVMFSLHVIKTHCTVLHTTVHFFILQSETYCQTVTFLLQWTHSFLLLGALEKNEINSLWWHIDINIHIT